MGPERDGEGASHLSCRYGGIGELLMNSDVTMGKKFRVEANKQSALNSSSQACAAMKL